MKTKAFLLFGIMAMLFSACSKDDDATNTPDPGDKQELNVNKNSTVTTPEAWRLEFPKLKRENNAVVVHTAPMPMANGVNYSIEWDINKHAQRWSCYQMYSNINVKNIERYQSDSNQYPSDADLAANYRLSSDPIWGSGFDHGHICPSADRLCSSEANYQTFYITNMHPQYKAFNGSLSGSDSNKNSWSPWYKLESQIRSWASQSTANRKFCDTLYVVKGGTIDSEENIIKYIGSGTNKIPVPKYFFVAVLCKNTEGYKAIGFWMEHMSSYSENMPIANYAVNVRELEQKTGIDFFCNLPDNIENQVEALSIDNVKRAWGLN